MLSHDELRALAEERGGAHVSVFLPLEGNGARTKAGSIRLKNLLAEAERLAEPAALAPEDVGEALAPARALLDDVPFWQGQAAGLALFLDRDGARDWRLAAPTEELVFVSDRFCVRPLLASVSPDQRFHVLALSQKQVRLVECTREGSREIDLHDIPKSLQDAVGYDYEQRSLQFRSSSSPFAAGAGGGGRRAAMFHGHGRATDKDKDEIERFARQVDAGVRSMIAVPASPLVIAAVGYVAAIYRDVSRHPNIVDGVIEGNPETASGEDLRRKALPIVTPLLDGERKKALADAMNATGSAKLVTAIGDTLALLEQGRIATLLVRDGKPLWGRLDGGSFVSHDERQPADDDLLDVAVHRALATKADVHSLPQSELPENAPLAGLLRY